jgi:hypothetical protein
MRGLLYASDEFFAQGGGIADGFLAILYARTLGRGIDATGSNSFHAMLNGGAARADVVRGVLNSREGIGDLVARLYRLGLHREPDAAGFDLFVSQVAQGRASGDVLAAILSSDEYALRS